MLNMLLAPLASPTPLPPVFIQAPNNLNSIPEIIVGVIALAGALGIALFALRSYRTGAETTLVASNTAWKSVYEAEKARNDQLVGDITALRERHDNMKDQIRGYEKRIDDLRAAHEIDHVAWQTEIKAKNELIEALRDKRDKA